MDINKIQRENAMRAAEWGAGGYHDEMGVLLELFNEYQSDPEAAGYIQSLIKDLHAKSPPKVQPEPTAPPQAPIGPPEVMRGGMNGETQR